MDGEEVVDVGEGGLHAAREGLVLRGAQQRIEPDEAVAAPVEAFHFLAEEGDVAAVPAVADDEDGGALAEEASAPDEVELAQGLAGAGAAAPVFDAVGGGLEGAVDVAFGELVGQAGEAGAEGEGLDPGDARVGGLGCETA